MTHEDRAHLEAAITLQLVKATRCYRSAQFLATIGFEQSMYAPFVEMAEEQGAEAQRIKRRMDSCL